MFEKQKAELVASKIQKYAGDKVTVSVIQENREWVVNIEPLEDTFVLEFKGVKVKVMRKQHGSV